MMNLDPLATIERYRLRTVILVLWFGHGSAMLRGEVSYVNEEDSR